MSERCFPESFKDLEPLAAWALETETARSRKRQASTMAEIQAFYDALLPRMQAVLSYLNRFPPDGLPVQEARLFYLSLALAEVAPAVELFQQPSEPDTYPVEKFIPEHE